MKNKEFGLLLRIIDILSIGIFEKYSFTFKSKKELPKKEFNNIAIKTKTQY